MTISSQDINSIVDALQRSDWDEAVVVIGDTKIAVARNGARLSAEHVSATAPAPTAQAPAAAVAPVAAPVVSSTAPAPVTPAAATAPAPAAEVSDDASDTDHHVTAPSVGTFWRAPEPSAPPFVQVGDHVNADDTVAIVEIMKLMNNVPAGITGTVTAIHVENSAAVQFGEKLISIRPDAA